MDKDSEFTDDQLIKLMATGDQSAFSVIYNKYWKELYNSAYKRLKDHDQCQDVLQNVFTDLWGRRERVEIKNLIAYLHGAIRMQVYKIAHKGRVQSAFFDSFDSFVSSSHCDASIIERELNELLDSWKAALPEKRRQIFVMRYEMDLSTKDIARELNISQKTVQNQLNTASTDLSEKLARLLLILIFIGF